MNINAEEIPRHIEELESYIVFFLHGRKHSCVAALRTAHWRTAHGARCHVDGLPLQGYVKMGNLDLLR